LRAALESGQTFAFTEADGAFTGVVDGRPATVSGFGGAGCEILTRPGDTAFWKNYFGLDGSYGALLKDFIIGAYGAGESGAGGRNGEDCAGDSGHFRNNESGVRDDKWHGESGAGGGNGEDCAGGGGNAKNGAYGKGRRFLTECVAAYPDLRLLRQPVWETICGFIISANNNLKRIASIYGRISENIGEPAEWAGKTLYSFPSASKLAAAGEDALRSLGLGYRAPYLSDTAKTVAVCGLPDLDGMPYEGAHKYLSNLRGVGEKVADCVLLFSTKHRNAFPVDVWMERVLREYYGMSGSRHKIKLEAQSLFGDAAGLVQQFLFHGVRNAGTAG
jgi:3-methyladenine DNA glycosylase/8-oxoguanine DNA glycosylase